MEGIKRSVFVGLHIVWEMGNNSLKPILILLCDLDTCRTSTK